MITRTFGRLAADDSAPAHCGDARHVATANSPNPWWIRISGSGQDRLNHVAVHVGQTAVDAVVPEREARVVDAHQVQNRGVQIIAISLPGGGAPCPRIALAVRGAALDAGTC